MNLTPPAVAVPARPVVVAATSPAGAVVRYTVLATDAAGAHVDARCSRASAAVFPIGVTTVSCTATDARGNTAQPSVFTVRVKGAPEQLADVLRELRAWNVRGALVTRVQQAARVANARPHGACLLVTSLQRDLRGALGAKLSAAHRVRVRSELARIARVAAC